MQRLFGLGLIVALLANCHSNPTRPLGDPLLKFSRQPAFGFCPPDGDIFKVTVWRSAGGTHTLTGSFVIGYDAPRDSCVNSVGRCLKEVPFDQRVLQPSQVTELERLLAAVPVEPHQINYACDPCLITRYEFDGRTEDNNPCATATEEYDRALAQLEEFLRTLALEKGI